MFRRERLHVPSGIACEAGQHCWSLEHTSERPEGGAGVDALLYPHAVDLGEPRLEVALARRAARDRGCRIVIVDQGATRRADDVGVCVAHSSLEAAWQGGSPGRTVSERDEGHGARGALE